VAVSAHNIAFGYLGEKALPGPDDDHGADITELLLPVPVIKVHNEVREFPPTVGAGNALESGYLASLLDVPAPVGGTVDLAVALIPALLASPRLRWIAPVAGALVPAACQKVRGVET